MHLYTYANHLWWAFNNKKFSQRETINDIFTAGVGICEQEPKSFKEECLITAHTIRATTQKDILVLLSGGIDGEVIVRSFVEAGIPIKIVIYRYKDNANEHEYQYGIRACKKLGIPFEVIDLDVIKMWEEDFSQNDFYTPVMSLAKYSLEFFNDCYVINGFMPPYFKQDNNNWYYYIRELSLFTILYSARRGIHSCGSFFQYRPENILSVIQDEMIDDLITNKVSLDNYYHYANALKGEFLAKFAFFEKHFPGVEWRPKYTGYELVRREYTSQGKVMLDHGPLANKIRDSLALFDVNELKAHLRKNLDKC